MAVVVFCAAGTFLGSMSLAVINHHFYATVAHEAVGQLYLRIPQILVTAMGLVLPPMIAFVLSARWKATYARTVVPAFLGGVLLGLFFGPPIGPYVAHRVDYDIHHKEL